MIDNYAVRKIRYLGQGGRRAIALTVQSCEELSALVIPLSLLFRRRSRASSLASVSRDLHALSFRLGIYAGAAKSWKYRCSETRTGGNLL